MKHEKHKQHLLNDLLQDDASHEWRAHGKEKALAAFRQARLWKRVGLVSRLAAVIAVLAGGAFLYYTHLLKNSPVPPLNELASQPVAAPLPTLTDDQLLASFPANTCYLAEVDGRKILVFVDPELQKKYVH
jgi:hypothetical protein